MRRKAGFCLATAAACAVSLGSAWAAEPVLGKELSKRVATGAMAAEAAQAVVPAQTAVAPGEGSGLVPQACARKVKVVYAGYGEAARANCTLASAEPTR